MRRRKCGVLFSNLRRDRTRARLRLRDVSNETGVAVSKLSEAERGLIELTPEERRRVREVIARQPVMSHRPEHPERE
jgi:transcriptional regulator with XRE-family HTH domain